MTKSPRKNVPDMGIELGAACMPSEHASDRTTAPGRTLVNPDFVTDHNPFQMSLLPDDYISDSFLQCFSADEGHTNSNGAFLLDFCKQTGMRIMNGRVGNDYGLGRYTFVGNRGTSIVDYVSSKPEFFNFVAQFEVQEPNILSDHSLIEVSFDFGVCQQQNELSETY